MKYETLADVAFSSTSKPNITRKLLFIQNAENEEHKNDDEAWHMMMKRSKKRTTIEQTDYIQLARTYPKVKTKQRRRGTERRMAKGMDKSPAFDSMLMYDAMLSFNMILANDIHWKASLIAWSRVLSISWLRPCVASVLPTYDHDYELTRAQGDATFVHWRRPVTWVFAVFFFPTRLVGSTHCR